MDRITLLIHLRRSEVHKRRRDLGHIISLIPSFRQCLSFAYRITQFVSKPSWHSGLGGTSVSIASSTPGSNMFNIALVAALSHHLGSLGTT